MLHDQTLGQRSIEVGCGLLQTAPLTPDRVIEMIDTDAFFSRRIARDLAKQRKAARDKINPPDKYILVQISEGHWRSMKVGSMYDLI